MIEIDLLKAFAAIVEEKGITSAAKKLGFTQSAMSMKLKRLEDLSKGTLILRDKKGFELTALGEKVFKYSLHFMEEQEQMIKDLHKPKEIQHLKIGIADHAVHTQLASLMKKFMEKNQDAIVTIETGTNQGLLTHLDEGSLDFVICHREKNYKPSLILMKENLMWLMTDRKISAAEELPLALFPEPCFYREQALKVLKKNNKKWNVVFHSASLSGIEAAVLSGFSASLLPQSCIPQNCHSFIENEFLPRLPQVELCLYGDGISEVKRSFISTVRKHFNS